MIAADTSSLIAFFDSGQGEDADAIAKALTTDELVLPPPVVAELRSSIKNEQGYLSVIARAPLITLTDGFWLRAGQARQTILSKGLKARLIDALIAQCCIDADVALIARDDDFRHFERYCGLKRLSPR